MGWFLPPKLEAICERLWPAELIIWLTMLMPSMISSSTFFDVLSVILHLLLQFGNERVHHLLSALGAAGIALIDGFCLICSPPPRWSTASDHARDAFGLFGLLFEWF